MNEPKVGDPVFNGKGEFVTEIGAIIGHHPFKVFGRDGNRYLVNYLDHKIIIKDNND